MSEREIVTSPARLKTLVDGNVTYGSSFDFEVTQKELEKAYLELNESENNKEDCILKLREKLETNKEFRYRTDDHYMLCYLRFRKFDVDKTYNTIRKAHSMRIQRPEIFDLPSNLEQLCNMGFISVLPYRDELGRILITAHYGKWNLAHMSFYEMLQVSTSVLDLIYMNPHCQINGSVGIWDFEGITIGHITPILNPRMLWALSSMMQECYPNRIKLGLFVNCNSLLLAAFNASKLVLKKKLVKRVKLLGSDVTEIHQYVSPALLPKLYGGTLGEDECSITGHVMDNLPYLRYIRAFRTATD